MRLKKDFFKINKFFILFVSLSILTIVWASKHSPVYISEIVSSNQHVIYDSTGRFHDYIELYNPSSEPVDISGWHLSDSKRNLKKYTFPAGSIIDAGQYYLVWADKKPIDVFAQTDFPYTDFSIRNGEKIYFSNANGKIIDKVRVPKKLPPNQSYARLPFVDQKAVREPSPAKANPLFKKKTEQVLTDVHVSLSQPSGFYDEPFQLQMTAPDGFDIYYTLDSTYPDKNSLQYTGPLTITDASQNPNKYAMIENITGDEAYVPQFLIDKATIVRAVAIRRGDGAKSNVSNASYFVGFQNKKGYKNLPIISMIVNPDDLFDDEKGIYVNGKIEKMNEGVRTNEPVGNYAMHGLGWRRPAFIESFGENPANWNGHYEIGIQGNFSTQNEQKGFKVFSDNLSEGKSYILRSGTEDWRSTKIREWLIQKLSEGRKVKTFDVSLAVLFLNGEYWGIYDLQEDVSIKNVADTYKIDPANLVIYKKYAPVNFTARTKKIMPKELADKMEFPDYAELDSNLTDEEKLEKLKNEIDIDSLIDYISIQMYIANRDWVINNLIRYRTLEKKDDAEQNARWHYILFDVDASSGIRGLDALTKEDIRRLPPGLKSVDPGVNTFFWGIFDVRLGVFPTFKLLLEDKQIKKKFIIAFQDIANYNFDPQKVDKFLNSILDNYLEDMPLTFKRFNRADYIEEDYIDEINLIRSFFRNRFYRMMDYLKEYFNLKGQLIPLHKIPSKLNGGEVLLNTLKLKADENYFGRYFSDYPVSLKVNTYPGYLFKGWRIGNNLISDPKVELNLSDSLEIEAVWEKTDKGVFSDEQ